MEIGNYVPYISQMYDINVDYYIKVQDNDWNKFDAYTVRIYADDN